VNFWGLCVCAVRVGGSRTGCLGSREPSAFTWMHAGANQQEKLWRIPIFLFSLLERERKRKLGSRRSLGAYVRIHWMGVQLPV
jgi:hypothetical protein